MTSARVRRETDCLYRSPQQCLRRTNFCGVFPGTLRVSILNANSAERPFAPTFPSRSAMLLWRHLTQSTLSSPPLTAHLVRHEAQSTTPSSRRPPRVLCSCAFAAAKMERERKKALEIFMVFFVFVWWLSCDAYVMLRLYNERNAEKKDGKRKTERKRKLAQLDDAMHLMQHTMP